ncbi:MAG: sodium ion-translocating decarboxylase subunit beta [[Eubacterium] siraeum]|nr:sodium ion-translocating decarboxylase subunit beta [[Eubacterium] siraeum]
MLETFLNTLKTLFEKSAFNNITPEQGIMLLLSFALMYLAIVKKFEPLLLLPIAFGMALTNIPGAELYHSEFFLTNNVDYGQVLHDGGLLDILYLGVKLQIFPPLIFLGIGTMTDFGPLIANPKSFLLGAAAQAGIFVTFLGACGLSMAGITTFTMEQAASIGIIGGADGPTAIFVTSKLAPEMLGSIAVAAYSYMALVPFIQRPIMLALTTKKERSIKMAQLRTVSKREKIIFPIAVTILVSFIVPDATSLVGMLMLGNLFRESGVVDRLVKTAQNELMNIITIMLGVTVGATATAANFLSVNTLAIILLGLVAFSIGTACGVLFAKLMNKLSGGKINPLIGSAGVSAVPMAARVSQRVGAETDPSNFLLMHAMGPNVAGVIGSAVAAGVLLSIFG